MRYGWEAPGMFTRVKAGLTYANVMATVAVFLALGGGAYAAFKLPKSSVGTRQLKNNAVNSRKVKDGSLLARDFKAGQLAAGPQGPKGDTGLQGPKGDQGLKGDQGQPTTAKSIRFLAGGCNTGAESGCSAQVLDLGDFQLNAKCEVLGSGAARLSVTTTSSGGSANWSFIETGTPGSSTTPKNGGTGVRPGPNTIFSDATPGTSSGSDLAATGVIILSSDTGSKVTTLPFEIYEKKEGSNAVCEFQGGATLATP